MKKELLEPLLLGMHIMAPDNGGAGGAGGKEPEASTDAEIENLKQQLQAEKQKVADAEKKLKDAEEAKLTDDERRQAAEKEEKAKTVAKIKELQAKAIGIDPKYVDLIKGETAEEIEKSANQIAAMIKENSEAVEKKVKETVARTGAPGASAEKDEAVNSKDFYASILEGQKS